LSPIVGLPLESKVAVFISLAKTGMKVPAGTFLKVTYSLLSTFNSSVANFSATYRQAPLSIVLDKSILATLNIKADGLLVLYDSVFG